MSDWDGNNINEGYDRYTLLSQRIDAKIWTGAGNHTVKLSAMGEDHLRNAIAFIQNGAKVYGFAEEWLPLLKEELKRRGLELCVTVGVHL